MCRNIANPIRIRFNLRFEYIWSSTYHFVKMIIQDLALIAYKFILLSQN